jgi:hypothetical protein
MTESTANVTVRVSAPQSHSNDDPIHANARLNQFLAFGTAAIEGLAGESISF